MRGLLIALSIYSRIPVPQIKWRDKDMKYSLCFFPFVGVIIAAALAGWQELSSYLGFGNIFRTLVITVIPIIITGGFHVDGYMDTMDAFHSYRSKEEKLKILSDPHIGAFSVIMTIAYFSLFAAAVSEITTTEYMLLAGAGFVISRVISAFMVIYLKPAKGDGMLKYFSDTAGKAAVSTVLILILAAVNIVGVIMVSWFILPETAATLLFAFYYKYKCYKEFGGVTGDTAGFYVTVTELLICIAVVIYKYI
ncbi:MAG: adenosylcobinamide-GDP ribazoletransferase [Eubacterium sp.]|nr:adenosylcobinamide-GDP ribazoletransferase [Eubacterium sp.]